MKPFEIKQDIDLQRTNLPMRYEQPLHKGNKNAHRWIVAVKDGGADADLSGAEATLWLTHCTDGSDMSALAKATISGSTVQVLFPAGAYALAGEAIAVMEITASGGMVMGAAVLTLHVMDTKADVVIDESKLVDVSTLLAQIAEARNAAEAANAAAQRVESSVAGIEQAASQAKTAVTNANTAIAKVDGMTVSATGGTAAKATISEQGGVKHIAFVLPKGDKGDKGDPGSIDNVTITSIAGLEEALANKQPVGSYVKTVDGKAPTSSGNVALGAVKSVNGSSPDASGNVDLGELGGGTVKSVNDILPDESGNVDLGALANSVAFNGSVLELQIMSGLVTLENVAAGKTASRKIRFNIQFNSTPAVVATVSASLPRDRFVGVYNTTSTEFTVYGANGSDEAMNIPIRWMAIGAIGDKGLNQGGGGIDVTEE